MNMWTTIGSAVFKLFILIVTQWMEKSAEKKKIKKEAIEEVKKGIMEKDPARITSGFDKARNA